MPIDSDRYGRTVARDAHPVNEMVLRVGPLELILSIGVRSVASGR